jgi:hypothetical protein
MVELCSTKASFSLCTSRLSQQQPRRTFLRKQQEEHTLGLILIGMSALFIFCQSFKIIPDLYELVTGLPSFVCLGPILRP